MLRPLRVVPRGPVTLFFLAITVAGPLLSSTLAQDPEEGPKPIPEVALDTLPTSPIRRDEASANVRFVDTTLQPRDISPRLEYEDQTADFALGQAVRGEASGASAVIVGDVDNGTVGTLTLSKIKGRFEDGENLVGANGGAAKAKGEVKPGIWVLDFAYKPARVRTVEIPGKGRRHIYYLYYRVINRTGKPRVFVPEFTLVLPETGKRYHDVVLPNAVQVLKVIEANENPSIQLLGAVDAVGTVPPSQKEGVDDAVFGVAIWEVDAEIAKADRFDIYVRGLSDGYKRVEVPGGSAPQVRYKALKLQFDRPGDQFMPRNEDIRPRETPYEWTYW